MSVVTDGGVELGSGASGAGDDHVEEGPFSLVRSDFRARIEERLGFDPRMHTRREQAVRVALLVVVTWIVPLLLASIRPVRPGALSFIADFEVHLRSLVAVPILLLAEGPIDTEVRQIVRSLVSPRRCRRPSELRLSVRSLQPLVSHPLVGVSLMTLALFAAPYWIRQHTSGRETWIFDAGGPTPALTAAGTWAAYVTVPAYVFLLVRWIWRWVVLALVFRTSAPVLRPAVSHGDRCGGFSFVSRAPARFALVLAGISSAMTARWLFTLVHQGAPAAEVTRQVVATLILSVILAFFPVLAFTPEFARAKGAGLRRYRMIVEGHVRNVERRWARRSYPVCVTSEESSSLADLNSVYGSVRRMRVVPYRRSHLLVVVLAAMVPMTPVLWFIVPIDEVLRDVLRALL